MQQTTDPLAVLHDQRLVEAELVLDLQFLRGIDDPGGVDQDVGDVARHEPHRHEDQDAHPEQREQHQRKPPQQIAGQVWSSSLTYPSS